MEQGCIAEMFVFNAPKTVEKEFVQEALFDKFKKDNYIKDIEFTTQRVSSKSQFDKLYKDEVYCAEGMAKPEEAHNAMKTSIMKNLKDWSDISPSCKTVHCYYCYGKDLNNVYHLTGDNRYNDKLGIFFLDWSDFGKSFEEVKHKGKFRYFSDVVDNNARREIRKGNKFYKDYHSIYGDEWFYSTV